jgi:nucleoside triphosphate pyrophosphatase
VSLILASSSPRRRELLQSLGLDFQVVPSNIPEVLRPGESPTDYVQRLAIEKGDDVAARHPEAWIIAADTTVVQGDQILEKPRDRADAIAILSTIVGRDHVVYTGLTLRRKSSNYRDTRVATTKVRMAKLSRYEIEWYVDTGEPMDKAGAYAVQGIGALFVESVDGNYTNVVGLPVPMLFDMMRRAGISPIGGAR